MLESVVVRILILVEVTVHQIFVDTGTIIFSVHFFLSHQTEHIIQSKILRFKSKLNLNLLLLLELGVQNYYY